MCLFGVHRLFEISMPVFNEYARVLLALHFVNTVACGEERGGGGEFGTAHDGARCMRLPGGHCHMLVEPTFIQRFAL